MTNQMQDEEILHHERVFDSVFTYDAGLIRSKFLIGLRDQQKILGIKCPECNTVYVPARTICNKCFVNMSEMVEVSSEGTLVTFSEMNMNQSYYPAAAPFMYAIVKLDGADTGLVHMLGEADPAKVKIGMRVKAVFNENRTGHIKDIKYFKPA
jgi:uncharacterized OB-fold protein